MENSKESKLIKNSLLFIIGELSSKLIIFIMMPFYTAFLSTEQFGISDLITTTVTLATPFFTAVITEAVIRFALDKNKDNKNVFSIGLYITLFGTILLGIISYFVFPYISSLKDYWFLFILYYITYNLYNIESNFIKGLNRVKSLAIIGIIHTLLLAGLNILLIPVLKMGISGYLLATIVSSAICIVILFFSEKLFQYLLPFSRLDYKLQKEMLNYSIPMIPNSAMWWINNSSDRYIVAYLVSTAANGVYSAAYRIPSIFAVLISIFMQAWQISVVDDFGTEEGNRFFNKIYNLYLESNVIICAALIISSKYLGKILFLGEFSDAWKYSVVLIIGYSFHSLAGFLGTIYTSAKKTNLLFTSTFIAAVANICLNILLILSLSRFGEFIAAMGAAIATVISYFLSYYIRRKKANQYVKLDINTSKFLVQYIVLSLMAILVVLNNIWSLGLAFVCFVYLLIENRKLITGTLSKIVSKIHH